MLSCSIGIHGKKISAMGLGLGKVAVCLSEFDDLQDYGPDEELNVSGAE